MPCHQVQKMSVEFHARHWDLLYRALDSLGWKWTRTGDCVQLHSGIELDLRAGKATLPSGQQDALNVLKQAYSRIAVNEVARRNAWQVQWQGKTKGVFARAF